MEATYLKRGHRALSRNSQRGTINWQDSDVCRLTNALQLLGSTSNPAHRLRVQFTHTHTLNTGKIQIQIFLKVITSLITIPRCFNVSRNT